MTLQRWEDGLLLSDAPLVENARCRLRLRDRSWMFSSDSCVNGLAHAAALPPAWMGNSSLPMATSFWAISLPVN